MVNFIYLLAVQWTHYQRTNRQKTSEDVAPVMEQKAGMLISPSQATCGDAHL